MTQEKLGQRAFAAWKPVMGFPRELIGAITLKQAGELDDVVEGEMVKFARAELQKAIEIVEQWGCDHEGNYSREIAKEIRQLME